MDITLDTLIYQLGPQLSLSELRSLCQTSPSLKQLCQNDRLWAARFNEDFPQSGNKPTNRSWFEFYVSTYNLKQLIRRQYPRAPPKPVGISYTLYYQLLERAKLLRVRIGVGRAVAATVYIIPRVTTLRSLLNDINNIILSNTATLYRSDDVNRYKLEFQIFSWGEYNSIFLLFKDKDDIIIPMGHVSKLEDGIFQSFYDLSNLYVNVNFNININFTPYYLSNDELDVYLLR